MVDPLMAIRIEERLSRSGKGASSIKNGRRETVTKKSKTKKPRPVDQG